MSAIILIPIVRGLESAPGDDALMEFLRGLSDPWRALVALGAVAFCAAFGWMVYALLRVLVPRRPLPESTNTTIESAAAVLLLVAGGQAVGAAFRVFGWNDILVRLAGTIVINMGCLGALAAFRRDRARGSPFPWWDLRPHAGLGRALAAMPVVFVAFMPIHFTAAVAWRCALHACGRPLDLQEVLLAPLDRGPLVIGAFAALAAGVVPVLEEAIFRGALYRSLRESLGRVGAAVASSLVFALLHFNEASLAPLFLLSILFVIVYEWSGSLWACVVLHACFNAVNFALA